MKLLLTVAENEVRKLFISPFAWLVTAALQFLLAVFFYLMLSQFMGQGAQAANRGLTETVVVGLFEVAGIMLLLISPVITMRSFSDELRSGTIMLLLSSPVSITELVLGKYLGVMAYYLGLVVLITLMPLSLMAGTKIDGWLMTSALLGLVLLLSVFAAIGIFLSTLSKSPALAAAGSFFLTFLLWISHIANDTGNNVVESIANYLSLQKHFSAMLSGAFSSADASYFILLASLFIALSICRMDAIRSHQ